MINFIGNKVFLNLGKLCGFFKAKFMLGYVGFVQHDSYLKQLENRRIEWY